MEVDWGPIIDVFQFLVRQQTRQVGVNGRRRIPLCSFKDSFYTFSSIHVEVFDHKERDTTSQSVSFVVFCSCVSTSISREPHLHKGTNTHTSRRIKTSFWMRYISCQLKKKKEKKSELCCTLLSPEGNSRRRSACRVENATDAFGCESDAFGVWVILKRSSGFRSEQE